MTKRRELEVEAQRLRGQGWTYEKIGLQLEVDEETVRRCLHDSTPPKEASTNASCFGATTPTRSEERNWPDDWTLYSLADLKDFTALDWGHRYALGNVAQSEGNSLIPWYCQRLVGMARRYMTYPGPLNAWLHATSGLPAIGEWLGAPECQALADLIEHYEPWNGGLKDRRARIAYHKGARPLVRAIKNRIALILISPPESADFQFPVYQLLSRLAAWCPMFDQTPIEARLSQA